MPRPGEPPRQRLLRLATRAGYLASVAIVFASGWFAMRSNDTKTFVLLTILAGGAGLLAMKFRQLGP